mgnify:CR=1 FL=1
MGIRYQSHVNPAALKSLYYSLEKDSPPVLLPKTAPFFINDIKTHLNYHPIKLQDQSNNPQPNLGPTPSAKVILK